MQYIQDHHCINEPTLPIMKLMYCQNVSESYGIIHTDFFHGVKVGESHFNVSYKAYFEQQRLTDV